MPATIIRADGTTAPLIADKEMFSLDTLQGVVGGLIEIVRLIDPENIMVVNEEGLLLALPYNHTASVIAHRMIVGDVLVCNSKMIE